MIEQWQTWISAFDACCSDDDWQRLTPLLTEDVHYCVAGAPFGCRLQGRDAVIAGFARSIRNFDRKFDERRWFGVGIRSFPPDAVAGRAMGWYRRGTLPPLTFSADSQWVFRGDRICLMTDRYDMAEADVQAALGWLGEHGGDLDPSYG